MTVYVPENRAEFLGNGVTTQFDFGFRFFADSNIRVTRVDADGLDTVLSAGYVVSGAGSLNGGSVTITSPVLATGERLIVERVLPVVQETDIRNQGRFFPEVHEDAWDYLTMLIQQNAGGLRQAIRVAASDPEPARLPGAASRANLLMGFNSAGDPVPVSPIGGSAADLALQLLNALDPAKGAAMIGYRGRTVRDKLDQWLDVKDKGAVGDYDPVTNTGTDDTAAFQDALDEIKLRGGGKLYVPAGYYKITAALSYSDAPLVIHGDGSDNSYIVQTTIGANGLDFTSTIPFNVPLSHGGRAISLCLYDLSIASPVIAGKAVNITMEDISSGRPFLTVRSVAVKSLQNTVAGFNFGIYGHNLNGSSIDEYYFEGDVGNSLSPGVTPYSTTAGIRLTGDLTHGNVRHIWSKLTIVGTNRAVWVDTWYEGIYLNGFEFGLVGIGLLHQGYVTKLNPNTFLENGQIDAKESAIVASNVTMVRLSNVDCFKGGSAPIASQNDGHIVAVTNCERFQMLGGEVHSAHSGVAENGINLIDCQNWSVVGTDFVACDDYGLVALNSDNGRIVGAGMKWCGDGILLDGTTANCEVTGNTFREFSGGNGYCVVLAAGAANNFVTGNFGEDITLVVVNNSTGVNKVSNNSGTGAGRWDFANGDTSPSVGVGAEYFNAANTGATTIQTLDNGYEGQEVTIFATNGNTTLQHGAAVAVPIYLIAGVNYTIPAGRIVKLLRNGSAWYEI